MKRLPWLMLALSGCAIHHVTPYVPDVSNAPQTADAAQASANCYEASTAAEIAICASPQLTAANRAMLAAFQTSLRAQTIFGRDALLASQRAWLLALPDQCHLSDPPKPAPAEAPACLASALAARASELAAWPAPPATPGGAIAQYVTFRPSAAAAAQPDPAFCPGFAARANDTLRTTGTLDPAAMGFSELAGTHGPDTAAPVSVDLYDANAFGLFQRRARGVAVGGTQLITPTSLTALLEAQNTANQGGRFSAFASQTGDYGSIDVFRDGARTFALAADPWGFTTPAAPGEAAHAGIWDITSGKATPVCLFDTYTRPAEPGVFDTLPSFSPWRDLLNQVRDSANLKLGQATKRDQGQLTADAAFTVLYMPLVARQQAAPWTLWLRRRHDDVLDALFTWSTQSAENKAVFDKLFALMRPAAADLVRAYQTTQALDAKEATQAGGTAVMELLYQATVNIAPGLGAAPDLASGYKPRYPILASPQ